MWWHTHCRRRGAGAGKRQARPPRSCARPAVRKAIHGWTLLTGIHARPALDRRSTGRRSDRVVGDERTPLRDEACAKGQLQECLPRPTRSNSLVKRSCDTVCHTPLRPRRWPTCDRRARRYETAIPALASSALPRDGWKGTLCPLTTPASPLFPTARDGVTLHHAKCLRARMF
jgi:hypothetical protein